MTPQPIKANPLSRITSRVSLLAFSVSTIALMLGAPTPALATDWADKIQLNGFGNWSSGWSDGSNRYSGAEPGGSYDNLEVVVSMQVDLGENFQAVIQPFVGKHSGFGEDEEFEFELELAFLGWQVSDQSQLRLGRLRLPFGYYTEVYDSGVSRPFVNLPQSVYGPSHFVAESIDGAEFSGQLGIGNTWNLSYHLYAGSMEFEVLEPHKCWLEVDTCHFEEALDDVVGGQLVVATDGGFRAGLSFYTGTVPREVTEEEKSREVVGAYASYDSVKLWLRAEFVRGEGESSGEHAEGAFIELAYRVRPQWQVATRWESLQDHISDSEEAELGPFSSLLDHQEVAVGLNYWPSSNVVFKLSHHWIADNHLALPEDFLDLLGNDGAVIEDRTRAWYLGASYFF